ncbi:hypothetical protein IRP63_15855 (plasmid) [Clostridium botulinum]|uniref:Uncharacterized protein n=2 Tax=Clostridium botulinum TaxID=1491 RepID=A0A9Q1UX36_CLOBO|nr:hypothetical protein [Clostridium botulinum]AEB77531.1 hypothetical protein CbC4_6006 [Clostridium botulinum BKT015925]KEH95931.1 hypothetical protein Y848_p0107 [Clostridium botulinum C/D str. Sp77]KEH96820.1 hypothetical protein Z953_13830 [Clostridium botulinum D str. 16868]KEH99931.1 hypothetical protein Z952_14820 [Clostridium botulinum C/D str. BKT75002]KEI05559.1 hypothetical protein Z954_15000 [Clostridium botulinum C/D str. BKT2873]
MKKIIPVAGYTIQVNFKNKVVSIDNDYELHQLYKNWGIDGITNLSIEILSEYSKLMNKNLIIDPMSLTIEIIAHIDVGKLSSKIPFIGNLITKHTDIIDCGEEAVDNNRWAFDLAANYL